MQVYVSHPDTAGNRPRKELKGFAKTGELLPGQTETVTVRIPVSYLTRYEEVTDGWKLPEGAFRFSVAASVDDERLSGEIQVK